MSAGLLTARSRVLVLLAAQAKPGSGTAEIARLTGLDDRAVHRAVTALHVEGMLALDYAVTRRGHKWRIFPVAPPSAAADQELQALVATAPPKRGPATIVSRADIRSVPS